MEDIYLFIQTHANAAPWLIFGLLLLAGFNIPISEDGMLFISALLAAKYPDLKYQLFLGVYGGAYFSDIICYWLGRILGPKIFKINLLKKMAPKERVDKIHAFYEKFGIITLILGRFIPFGVRNGLFLTAGLSKMNFLKFSLSDLLACTISTVFFFNIYLRYGNSVIDLVKKGNLILFGMVILGVFFWYFQKRRRSKIIS